MEEEKKVVYNDGDRIKVAVGLVTFEDYFVVVETKLGTVRIGKSVVVSIKPHNNEVTNCG